MSAFYKDEPRSWTGDDQQSVMNPFLAITFQHGPAASVGVNGTCLETLIEICLERLGYFQTKDGGKFACPENERAIRRLKDALEALNDRTERRIKEGTEGTDLPGPIGAKEFLEKLGGILGDTPPTSNLAKILDYAAALPKPDLEQKQEIPF
jgi:hypothetical protein